MLVGSEAFQDDCKKDWSHYGKALGYWNQERFNAKNWQVDQTVVLTLDGNLRRCQYE